MHSVQTKLKSVLETCRPGSVLLDILLFMMERRSLSSSELMLMHDRLIADDGSAILYYLDQGQQRFEENNVPTLTFSSISFQRMKGMSC